MVTEKRFTFSRTYQSGVLEMQLWKRGLAFFLDYLLLKIVIIPAVFWVINLFITSDEGNIIFSNENILSHTLIFYIFNLLVYCTYFTLLESSILQATFGKRFIGYKIVNQQGFKITFLEAFLRFMFKIVSFLTIAGVLMIDLNKKKQGLHDIICKTYVIKLY